MFRFQCGYRHQNGSLVAYVGYGFASYSARDNAVSQIRKACEEKGEPCLLTGPGTRFVESANQCTKGEQTALKTQWRSIINAKRKAGASIA